MLQVVFCFSASVAEVQSHIHLIIRIRAPFVNVMCLASGLIHFQIFLAVQNRLFCCLIFRTGVVYHIILMYFFIIMNSLV